MFLNGRTYPRSNDVNQINIAKYSRANNVDTESSYHFSEGGFLTLNAYIIYLEMLYGTKYLVNPDTFGSGISRNSGIGNDENYHNDGALKHSKKAESTSTYATWNNTSSTIHY